MRQVVAGENRPSLPGLFPTGPCFRRNCRGEVGLLLQLGSSAAVVQVRLQDQHRGQLIYYLAPAPPAQIRLD